MPIFIHAALIKLNQAETLHKTLTGYEEGFSVLSEFWLESQAKDNG